jgi:hypothetical protein
MKIKSLLLIMLIAVCAASCSKDDDDAQVKYSSVVAGTYKGSSSALFKYITTPMVTDNDTTLISALTDNTVNIVYKSATWGKMTVNGATVTESNNLYTISGSGTVLMGMSGSTPKNYDCTFTGTVEAGHANPKFVMTIPSVMGGLVITFSNTTTTTK